MDPPAAWPDVFSALLVSHLVGDVLLQTDWQATTKSESLADPAARRALRRHVAVYTAAFVPGIMWMGNGRAHVLRLVASVAIPHLVIDEGHLVRAWLRRVKRVDHPSPALTVAVDQSFHTMCLLAVALAFEQTR